MKICFSSFQLSKQNNVVVFFLCDFLVANIHLCQANAQIPYPEASVGSSGALTLQLPNSSKETNERTKKHQNHKYGHDSEVEPHNGNVQAHESNINLNSYVWNMNSNI